MQKLSLLLLLAILMFSYKEAKSEQAPVSSQKELLGVSKIINKIVKDVYKHNQEIRCMTFDNDKHIYLLTASSTFHKKSGALLKFNENGQIMWRKTVPYVMRAKIDFRTSKLLILGITSGNKLLSMKFSCDGELLFNKSIKTGKSTHRLVRAFDDAQECYYFDTTIYAKGVASFHRYSFSKYDKKDCMLRNQFPLIYMHPTRQNETMIVQTTKSGTDTSKYTAEGRLIFSKNIGGAEYRTWLSRITDDAFFIFQNRSETKNSPAVFRVVRINSQGQIVAKWQKTHMKHREKVEATGIEDGRLYVYTAYFKDDSVNGVFGRDLTPLNHFLRIFDAKTLKIIDEIPEKEFGDRVSLFIVSSLQPDILVDRRNNIYIWK